MGAFPNLPSQQVLQASPDSIKGAIKAHHIIYTWLPTSRNWVWNNSDRGHQTNTSCLVLWIKLYWNLFMSELLLFFSGTIKFTMYNISHKDRGIHSHLFEKKVSWVLSYKWYLSGFPWVQFTVLSLLTKCLGRGDIQMYTHLPGYVMPWIAVKVSGLGIVSLQQIEWGTYIAFRTGPLSIRWDSNSA